MKFRRLGRAIHPVIETSADLQEACTLDIALWVATSAPVHAFRLDPVFLTHLDSDKDTRIKSGELQEAITWTLDLLQDHEGLEAGSDVLKSSSLHPEHPKAPTLKTVLSAIGEDEKGCSLEDIRKARTRLEQQPVSESGVILPDAAGSEVQQAHIEKILSLIEGAPHPSGKKGLSKEVIEEFRQRITKRLAWLKQTEQTDEFNRSMLLPLGESTPAAFEAYEAIRERVEHFFQLCEAMEMAPESTAASWPGVPKELNWQDTQALHRALREAPLAEPDSDRILKMNRKINPAWQHDLHRFRQQVMIPLLDKTDDTLTEDIWNRVCERFSAYETWKSQEPSPELSELSSKEITAWAETTDLDDLVQLCEQPSTNVLTLTDVRLAEKLALYQKDLLTFANNFIAFPHLYRDDTRACFEMGTLVMDGRKFHLAVNVPNRAEYLKSLQGATMFIMIVEVAHTSLNQKFEIAVPATAGQQGNLSVGKHGVFQHVDGTQWFATIVHIQDNAISFAEAVFEPFKRLGQAMTRKIESLTQAAEKKLDTTGGEAVTQLKEGASPGAGGMLAGGGIAVAALGSSLAFITKIFSEIKPLGVAQGLLAAILAVLIPGSIVAAIRLSKRDLSVLLEGADWAVNSRMRLNRIQRKSFTQVTPYPKGSKIIRPLEWWLWCVMWVLLLIALVVNGVALV